MHKIDAREHNMISLRQHVVLQRSNRQTVLFPYMLEVKQRDETQCRTLDERS